MDGKDKLLAALQEHQLTIVEAPGKLVTLEYGYTVEIEGPELFKLSEEGYVVAPFNDARELAAFVRQDLEASGKLHP